MPDPLNTELLVINVLLWILFLFSLVLYDKTESNIVKYLSYFLFISAVAVLILTLIEIRLLVPS